MVWGSKTYSLFEHEGEFFSWKGEVELRAGVFVCAGISQLVGKDLASLPQLGD